MDTKPYEPPMHAYGYPTKSLDIDTCGFYARKNCNTCYGRGYGVMSFPARNRVWLQACNCVLNNLSRKVSHLKEIKEYVTKNEN